jgi:hypothetical protein
MACSLAAGRKEGSITRNAMTATEKSVFKVFLGFLWSNSKQNYQVKKGKTDDATVIPAQAGIQKRSSTARSTYH